jgi:hypothetical protein
MFIIAIQKPNSRISELDTVGNIAILVLGTVWVFCLTKKELIRKTSYSINEKNYLQWYTNNLSAQLTQQYIILLDNTKYHVALDTHVPKNRKINKQKACLFLEKGDISFFNVRTSAIDFKQVIRSFIAENKRQKLYVWQSLVDTESFSPPPCMQQ